MNVRRAVMPVVSLLAFVGSAFAQHRVDPGRMYERIYAIVPMVGTGTWDDPRRPQFVPLLQQVTPGARTGILAFNHVESDDGKFALVEIVAADRTQLAQVVGQMSTALSAVAGFQLFDRANTSTANAQSAFQALKKNFDITKFQVVVP